MAAIKYSDLVATLTKQASILTATKRAGADDGGVTDPNQKGVVSIPVDPNAAPALAHVPESKTNADVTPVTTVAPARTVDQSKNASDLSAKAANVVAGIRALMSKTATAAEITPTLPNDKGNDNKNSTPTEPTTGGPAKKQNPDPEAAKTASDSATPATGGTPADPNAKKVEVPKTDSKGEIPASKTNADDTTKKEAGVDVSFDPAFHFKIASSLLATEQGRAYVQSLIEAEHGAAEADSIIKAAAFMEQQFNDLQTSQAEGEALADALWQQATPEQQNAVVKMANTIFLAKETLTTELEKQAFDDGAATAAAMQDQGGAPGAPAGAPPMPGADAGAGAPPAGPEGGADGQGEVSDEDIVQVLQELVQNGEVKPEEAEAILQALLGGGDQGGGSAPGEQGGMPGGEEMPPEAKAASEIVKSASVLTDTLLNGLAAPAK